MSNCLPIQLFRLLSWSPVELSQLNNRGRRLVPGRRARAAVGGRAQAASVHQPAEPAHHAPHFRVHREGQR